MVVAIEDVHKSWIRGQSFKLQITSEAQSAWMLDAEFDELDLARLIAADSSNSSVVASNCRLSMRIEHGAQEPVLKLAMVPVEVAMDLDIWGEKTLPDGTPDKADLIECLVMALGPKRTWKKPRASCANRATSPLLAGCSRPARELSSRRARSFRRFARALT
ncbi:hypothetical protein AMAG_19958 [Allomyces macrogynus ATCC 38327]|uniref:Uncharacterized protein n=1 Tax=Allomyces macrogynus (strain ATCC 38327) TaxID=578462 RepID=A0A0L0T2L9_ALLM3|nr:hypothetical protein AMAG_19958 [Allomyces macrogynus ATCC 38327]|eukprot:KNE69093.1 hypothetical protein AMAG_19958 [Allomyces macrogynus ATCC 38327]